MLGPERAGKEYVCDCERHCKGHQKKVSRSTYQRHAPYRKIPFSKGLQHHVPTSRDANRNNLSPDRREGASSNDTREELHTNSQPEDMVPGAEYDLNADLMVCVYNPSERKFSTHRVLIMWLGQQWHNTPENGRSFWYCEHNAGRLGYGGGVREHKWRGD
jgi:hypothetical protein